MDIIREKTMCFTGHRPEKLPGSGESSATETRIIKSMLYKEICYAADCGFDTFITGMQRGIDLWAGEIVLDIASKRGLKLIAVLPYRDIGRSYKNSDKWAYGRIMQNAADIIIISEKYCSGCMQQRNKFMVDSSSAVLGVVYNSVRSGTAQTLRYAASRGLDIHKIDLNDIFPSQDQLTLL